MSWIHHLNLITVLLHRNIQRKVNSVNAGITKLIDGYCASLKNNVQNKVSSFWLSTLWDAYVIALIWQFSGETTWNSKPPVVAFCDPNRAMLCAAVTGRPAEHCGSRQYLSLLTITNVAGLLNAPSMFHQCYSLQLSSDPLSFDLFIKGQFWCCSISNVFPIMRF